MTSQVTSTPLRFAMRTSSTDSAVLTCAKWRRPPVSSASEMSRATMTDSAEAGTPLTPSRLETQPSCIGAPPDSSGTSQWLMMGRPSEVA